MVLHENKAEIRTEGGATKLCLCVRFIYLFIFYFRLYFLSNELLSALFFFPFHDLSFAYALCDQFDVMIMPCKIFRNPDAKIKENVITLE